MFIQQKDNGCILILYIQPNSSKNEIVGLFNGALKIKIKAPPIDGKANAEIINYLSEVLSIPKKNISLEKGETGRNKRVRIKMLAAEDLRNILTPYTIL